MENQTPSRNNDHLNSPEAVKQAIIDLLIWDEERYAQYQFKTGLNYLKMYLEDDFDEDQLSRSKIFWQWWRNHWINRDRVFLSEHSNDYERVEILRQQYIDAHDPEMLAGCIKPQSVVLNETYVDMIDELVKYAKEMR